MKRTIPLFYLSCFLIIALAFRSYHGGSGEHSEKDSIPKYGRIDSIPLNLLPFIDSIMQNVYSTIGYSLDTKESDIKRNNFSTTWMYLRQKLKPINDTIIKPKK